MSLSMAKNGSDMLMDRLTVTNPPLTHLSASVTAGRLVVGHRSQLEPPFSRHIVDSNKVADGGRYGRWAIGHGQGTGYWDRSSPQSSRPPSSSRAHDEVHQHRQQMCDKYQPGHLPFETTFHRVLARSENPAYSVNVGKRAPLVGTSTGVVGR